MKPKEFVTILGGIGVFATLVSSCATRETTAPPAPTFSVTGHVRLIGYLTARNGGFLGTEIVDNADDVVVDMIFGSKVVATTRTVAGNYRFEGIRPGGYKAITHPFVADFSDTIEITVASLNIFVSDTLLLASKGDLYPAPNPSTDTVGVFYNVPFTQNVDLRIRDLSGATVRILNSGPTAAGDRSAQWLGHDQSGNPAVGNRFWVTYEALDGTRCQLLLR